MRYRIYSLAALANLLPHFTLADFVIYAGQSNNYDLVGASDQTNLLSIYPYTPDCGMVGNDVPFTNYNNDLDIGGYACDGCSDAVAVKDWYITRLEFNNGPDAIGGSQPTLSYATGDRISLYQSDGYRIHGGDGIDYGYCDRVQDGSGYNCFGGTATPSGLLAFRCYSSLSTYGGY